MDFEKLTDRARGFLQAAQTIAVREHHQRIAPAHLLKALLEDEQGMAAGLIEAAGGDAEGRASEKSTQLVAKIPAVTGSGATQAPGIDGDTIRILDQAEQIANKAGDSYVTVERILLAMALAKGTDVGKALAKAGVTPQNLNAAIEKLRGGRTADTQGAEDRYDALEEIRARPHRGGARGQARPGHRPRRGNPPHHPGARPPDQEQSGADRRARRRQDRDRRRPGAAHRQWRRARRHQGQAPAGARHGRADRRREISRRVRGAAEGRARRGQAGRGRHHPVHRRDAHLGRRREGRGRDGRRQPAQAGAGARRAALHRRDHARRISQAYREGRGARAALPAGVRRRADGRGHDLDPARPQGEIRASPRRPHHRRRDRRRGDALATATSPTASCPTRRST